MSISNYAENKILDHLTGVTSWTMPADVYVQLHTGDPGENGTQNTANNSIRVMANWSSASSGSISITGTVYWVGVNSAETYSHWSAWDAETAGNCLWTGQFTANVPILVGESFQITSLSLALD